MQTLHFSQGIGHLLDNRALVALRAYAPDLTVKFRVYVRWPSLRVSDKTTTDIQADAEAAFRALVDRAEVFAARGAIGLSLTGDGRQLEYIKLGRKRPN